VTLRFQKIGQLVDPYRNPIGQGQTFRNLISMWDKGMITRPLYQSQKLLPATDWKRKNKKLEGTEASANPWDDVYGIPTPEMRAQMPVHEVKIPPLPLRRHGPGGAQFAALARAWGASPELIKSMAPPPIRYDREGARIQ